jgi:hypothetical protein
VRALLCIGVPLLPFCGVGGLLKAAARLPAALMGSPAHHVPALLDGLLSMPAATPPPRHSRHALGGGKQAAEVPAVPEQLLISSPFSDQAGPWLPGGEAAQGWQLRRRARHQHTH